VDVPAKNVVTFKPGKEMEERVRQLNASMAQPAAASADRDARGDGADNRPEPVGAKAARSRRTT
jgi:hypothetical protein